MSHGALLALGRIIRLHPDLTCLIELVAPIAAAYWWYALAPYRRSRLDALRSPRHMSRPAVPGVLEHYATWVWANERDGDRVLAESTLPAEPMARTEANLRP